MMNIVKIGLVILLSTLLVACDQGTSATGVTEVSVADVKDLPINTETTLLDVRTAGEYASGHVPNAKNISVQELGSRLNELDKNQPVYVYCESGVRSTKAANLLAEHGFTKVFNMRASMRGWRNAEYPIEK